MAQHHPSSEVLLEYASGSQHEPLALLVATHLALCPACRAEVQRLEAVGGALLEAAAAAPLRQGSVEAVLARLEGTVPEAGRRPEAAPRPASDAVLPRPLRDYVGGSLNSVRWQARGGVAEAELLPDFPGYKTRLLKIGPGVMLPAHTHKASEYTIVLAGGFSDEQGHYLRGDVAYADSRITHRPVADPGEACICLAVTDGPLRLTGPVGRLLNFFVRI